MSWRYAGSDQVIVTAKETEQFPSAHKEANALLPVGSLVEQWVSSSPKTPEEFHKLIRSLVGKEKAEG